MASNAVLADRAVLELTGPDTRSFLQGLVTNDVLPLADDHACWAGLLSPQGKVLFDMLVIGQPDGGLWLDVEAARAAELAKKLTLYRLRAKVTISRRDDLTVTAHWGGPTEGVADPRDPALGTRTYGATVAATASMEDYRHHRLSLGVPEGATDIPPDRLLWLEADGDLFHGVSFTKGCYVGQENTARMHHRSKVRKRLVPLDVPADAEPGAIMAGEREAGTLHSQAGTVGLGLMRMEYLEQGATLLLGGAAVSARPVGPFAELLAAPSPAA